MPVGSHKDAFKAHQFVKKLVDKEGNTLLANLAGNILLDFVKNQRQINSDGAPEKLPDDPSLYDQEKLSVALKAVGSLCGMCEEAHDNACFVNQARRVLIAAKTGVDLGLLFDGKKTLEELIAQADILSAEKKKTEKSQVPSAAGASAEASGLSAKPGNVSDAEFASMRQKIELLTEKEIFRGTLIDEIVATIKAVSEGNYAAEMPVHDDEQLGKLAVAFNLMLKTIQKTMAHLDQLVNARSAELKQIMNSVPIGLLSFGSEFRINPEYSKSSETILGAENLRGRDFLDTLGLTHKREEERLALKNYLEFMLLGIPNPDMDRLNPFKEIQLPGGRWAAISYHLLQTATGDSGVLVQLEDITEKKRLLAQIEATERESAQIKAIAEAPELFRDFLRETQNTLDNAVKSLEKDVEPSGIKDLVNEMFRGVHTIKGMAGSFGMSRAGKCAAELENTLEKLRENTSVSSECLPEVRNGFQTLNSSLDETKKVARLILGEEAETSGAILRIPLSEIRQIEESLRKFENPENGMNQVIRHVNDLQKITARKAFLRITRLIPGLMERLQKNAEFSFIGEETPIHYEMAQQLSAPLMHLLRNAFDHAIEMPEQRLSAGKPEQGKISLTVSQKSDFLEIAVEDDGKGLHSEELRKKAIQKALLSSEKAASLSESDCFDLIFLPGFSTAESVSDISGRGVGMDVVKTAIQNLSGSIMVKSIQGKGTSFILKIPHH
ncbi:MAG: Hpt domain-containing protein [Candidatus Riflebacteria bacterium]|nr:Hpt domain-containing protein [Candidatus Riflebacteria bacterium]